APSPLLNVQVALGLVGNVGLLLGPAVRLVSLPALFDARGALEAEPGGWLALFAAFAASLWHLRQTAGRASMHVLCGLGLALGALGEDPSGHYWPAGAMLAVSLLAGGMALWQRSDGWTFAAGLGVNLAVSLLFWEPLIAPAGEAWLIRLVQVNAVTSALLA